MHTCPNNISISLLVHLVTHPRPGYGSVPFCIDSQPRCVLSRRPSVNSIIVLQTCEKTTAIHGVIDRLKIGEDHHPLLWQSKLVTPPLKSKVTAPDLVKCSWASNQYLPMSGLMIAFANDFSEQG